MKQADISQLALMRQGIDYSFEIACRAFKFKVRPLTNIEIINATAQAASKYAAMPESQRVTMTASLLSAMHQLEMASTKDVGEPPQVTVAMLEMMTPNEVNHLWKQYVQVTDRVNPSFEEMTMEELEPMVEALKKSLEPRSQLIDLPISKLIAVSCHLLKQLQDLPQVK